MLRINQGYEVSHMATRCRGASGMRKTLLWKSTGSRSIRRGWALRACREQEDTLIFLERIWINYWSRDKTCWSCWNHNKSDCNLSFLPFVSQTERREKPANSPRRQRKANKQHVEPGSPQGRREWGWSDCVRWDKSPICISSVGRVLEDVH